MSEDVQELIRTQAVPGTITAWRWRPYGHFGRWRDYEVEAGALVDGRWYVRRLAHTIGGPARAQLYRDKEAALAVARAVQAAAEPALREAGYRPLDAWAGSSVDR